MRTAILLSGGMDSTALLWWKKPEVAISINYGQLAAKAEINAASLICKATNTEHYVENIDCSSLGSGDMSSTRETNRFAQTSDWWPYRNQMLITFAAMKAVALDVNRILIGTVNSDGSHLDGTKDFIAKINDLIGYQEGHIVIEAPAIEMSTVELIRLSCVPLDILCISHSCHKANVPCGNCRGCNKYFEVHGTIHDRMG